MSDGNMSDLTIQILRSIRDEVKGLRGELADVRTDLREGLGQVRDELAEVRDELKGGLAQVNGRLDNLIAFSGARYTELERRVSALEKRGTRRK